MNEQPWILITGNPLDGFTYLGSFPDFDAVAAAGEDLADADWWAVQLELFDRD